VARILVVDDEPRICRFVSRALEGDGHAVTTTGTGAEALKLAAKRHYALIVLDLMLPGIGGIEVLRRVIGVRPDQRVLVLSAIGDVATKVACFSSGAIDYLPKPFALAELVARVRIRAVEPHRTRGPRSLQAGTVSLDMFRHTATVRDRCVQLSQREFVLLTHLMRHAGEVCGRDELLAAVWGGTFDTSSNVVDVYVRRLRRKLEAGSIETVRNVGYCFVSG
jgi:two-component system copper resistance phosphate regulon response regulator CusR